MAAATFDIRDKTSPPGDTRQQTTRRVEYVKRIRFADTPLAATQDAALLTLPAGFILERIDPILRVAEGQTATMHLGVEADDDALAVSVNLNGTPNARAAIGSPAMVAGQYFHTATEIRVKCPAAANTLDVAVVDVIIVGYLIKTV